MKRRGLRVLAMMVVMVMGVTMVKVRWMQLRWSRGRWRSGQGQRQGKGRSGCGRSRTALLGSLEKQLAGERERDQAQYAAHTCSSAGLITAKSRDNRKDSVD